MNRYRSLLPIVAVLLALSSSLSARAGAAPSDDTRAQAEAGGHATADSVSHSVNRAADATERGSKKAVAATSRGIHTAIEATKRGIHKAGKAVEHAAEKAKEAFGAKHDER